MATIVYTGSEPELEVEVGVNWWITFTPGTPTDVPDTLANGTPQQGESGDDDYQCARAGLLVRDDFELAVAPPAEPVPEAETPAPPAEGA